MGSLIEKKITSDLNKARTGRYEDNSKNRRLHRVGQEYGSKGEEKEDKKSSDKKDDNSSTIHALESKIEQMKKNKRIFVEQGGEARYNKALETLQSKLDSLKGEKKSNDSKGSENNGEKSKNEIVYFAKMLVNRARESKRDESEVRKDLREMVKLVSDEELAEAQKIFKVGQDATDYQRIGRKVVDSEIKRRKESEVDKEEKANDASRNKKLDKAIEDGGISIGNGIVGKITQTKTDGALSVSFTDGKQSWNDTVQPGSSIYWTLFDSDKFPRKAAVRRRDYLMGLYHETNSDSSRKAYKKEIDRISEKIGKSQEEKDMEGGKKGEKLKSDKKKEKESEKEKSSEKKPESGDNEKTEVYTRVKFDDVPNSGKVNLKKYLSEKMRRSADEAWGDISKIDTAGLKKMEQGLVEDFNRQFDDLPKSRRAEKLYAIMKVKGELQKRGKEPETKSNENVKKKSELKEIPIEKLYENLSAQDVREIPKSFLKMSVSELEESKKRHDKIKDNRMESSSRRSSAREISRQLQTLLDVRKRLAERFDGKEKKAEEDLTKAGRMKKLLNEVIPNLKETSPGVFEGKVEHSGLDNEPKAFQELQKKFEESKLYNYGNSSWDKDGNVKIEISDKPYSAKKDENVTEKKESENQNSIDKAKAQLDKLANSGEFSAGQVDSSVRIEGDTLNVSLAAYVKAYGDGYTKRLSKDEFMKTHHANNANRLIRKFEEFANKYGLKLKVSDSFTIEGD